MKRILWQKFKTPFEKIFYPRDHQLGDELDPLTESEQDALDSFNLLSQEYNQPESHEVPEEYQIGPCFMSEFGPIPLLEHALPSRNFNLWVGHTNWPLNLSNNQDVIKIASIYGVEDVHVYTPYRFRIAIAKCFNAAEVRNSIEDIFNEKRYKASLTFEDGTIKFVQGDSRNEVNLAIKAIKRLHKITSVRKSWVSTKP